ncbi:MAG: tripartite tricarboxylate transporter TctB family protein [Deltaproteobacteria bacterium]|nr:tripartite tricarboxylate transporter TctB family protein [Deltaproteobacteria bacterium]
MGEKIITGLLCFFSVICYGIAMTIPPPFVQTPVGAAFWPKLILGIVFGASAIHLVKLFFRKADVETQLVEESEKARKREEEETGEREVPSLFFFGTLLSLIYITCLKWIGFTVATPIFTAAFLYGTGYRNKLMLVLVSICTAGIFLFLFVKLTFIPLPRGYGIFRSISYLVY